MILKAGFLSCFGLIKFGEERRRGGGRVGSHGLLKRNEIRPSDSLSPLHILFNNFGHESDN